MLIDDEKKYFSSSFHPSAVFNIKTMRMKKCWRKNIERYSISMEIFYINEWIINIFCFLTIFCVFLNKIIIFLCVILMSEWIVVIIELILIVFFLFVIVEFWWWRRGFFWILRFFQIFIQTLNIWTLKL